MQENAAECKRLCVRIFVFEAPLEEIRAGRKTGKAEALKVCVCVCVFVLVCVCVCVGVCERKIHTH